jgi:hypothetical protein
MELPMKIVRQDAAQTIKELVAERDRLREERDEALHQAGAWETACGEAEQRMVEARRLLGLRFVQCSHKETPCGCQADIDSAYRAFLEGEK